MTIRKVLALILILAILAAGGYYLLKTEQDDNERMRNLYAEAEPLERERASLVEERNTLSSEYALKFRDYATTEILFTSLSSHIIKDAYPVMRDHDVVGILGFSYQEFPTHYNKLTVDDCLKLIGDGWGTCLIYEQGWSSFTTWYEALCKSMESYKLPTPTAVYFPDDATYTEELDEELAACGIKTVIRNAIDGRTNTVTDVTGKLWFTGAMPFNYTGSATDTELLGRTDGGNLCFTLSLTDPKSGKADDESPETESLRSVLDSWKEMLWSESPLDELESVGPTPSIYIDPNDKEQLHDTMQQMYLNELTPAQQLLLPRFRSVTFETALQSHRDALANNDEMQSELDARQAELDEQIAELDTRIREIYDRWGELQPSLPFGGKSS